MVHAGINNDWNFLDWSYVCDQSPKVRILHEKRNRNAEYGVNFFEFIETEEGLTPLVQEWWDSIGIERQKFLLTTEKADLETKLRDISIALNSY